MEDHWEERIRVRRAEKEEQLIDEEVDVVTKQESKIPEKYIVSYKNKTKLKWDYFVLVLAIWNAIVIPFDQAFEPYALREGSIVLLNFTIDLVFLVDIILGFFTSVIDSYGRETLDSKVIKEVYTSKPRFYADFLSIFGASVFENIHPLFKIFGYFKLIRVLRINNMIASANIETN